jgi:hypothetical protein
MCSCDVRFKTFQVWPGRTNFAQEVSTFSHVASLALEAGPAHDRQAFTNWGILNMQRLLKSLKYMLGTSLSVIGGSAWSDCACFCVAGELQTMCTTVVGAQDSPTLCPPMDTASCPQDTDASSSADYEAPESDAINCRDVRVYDAIRGEYVTAKACNVI